MARTSDVVSNTPILASWGNEVRDRTVQVFANAAERTAQWVSPPAGAPSYLADHPGVLYLYEGGAWVAQGGGRELVRARMVADQTLTGQPFDLLPLDCAFTAVPTRIYRTELYIEIYNAHTTGNGIFFAITDAGVNRATILREGINWAAAAKFVQIRMSLRETGLSGAKVRGARFQGSDVNNWTVYGTSNTQYSEMWVTDVGST